MTAYTPYRNRVTADAVQSFSSFSWALGTTILAYLESPGCLAVLLFLEIICFILGDLVVLLPFLQ